VSPEPAGGLRRSLSDTALLALGAGLSAVFGLASLRLLLGGLSEADYGRYSLFHAVAGVLGVFVAWPTGAVLRLGAEEVDARGRVGRTLGSVAVLLALGLLAVSGVTWVLRDRIDAFCGAPVAGYALLLAGLTSLATLAVSVLQPTGLVRFQTLAPGLTRVAYAALLALVLVGGGLRLEQAMLLAALASVPGILGPLVLARRSLGGLAVDGERLRRAARFGLPLILFQLGVAGLLYVDVVAIRAWVGEVAAGRYDVAYRVSEQLSVAAALLAHVAGPLLATAAARGQGRPLARYFRLAVPQLVWLWSLATGLLLVAAEPALALLGAKSAAASGAVLQLLLVAVVVRLISTLDAPVFQAHLISIWPTGAFLVGFAVNLGLDVALLSAGFGIEAPAAATIAGFGVQAVLRSFVLARRFGVAAWRPYLGVLPILALLGWDRLTGGGWLVTGLGWLVLAAAVLVAGRRAGIFPRETLAILPEVRMPAGLRRALERFYRGAPG